MAGELPAVADRSVVRFFPLDRIAACDAIRLPLEQEDVSITSGALDAIFAQTPGYPYFLQEWGKHSWDLADASPIDEGDVANAGIAALAELDSSFFRVRFDRLSLAEKRYMRAMAELGEGPHRSGDIAEALGMKESRWGFIPNITAFRVGSVSGLGTFPPCKSDLSNDRSCQRADIQRDWTGIASRQNMD